MNNHSQQHETPSQFLMALHGNTLNTSLKSLPYYAFSLSPLSFYLLVISLYALSEGIHVYLVYSTIVTQDSREAFNAAELRKALGCPSSRK